MDVGIEQSKLIDENQLSENGMNMLIAERETPLTSKIIDRAEKQRQLNIVQGMPEATANAQYGTEVLKAKLEQFKKLNLMI